MKTKLLVASALAMVAVQANAGIGVIMRSDYYNNSKFTNTSNQDVPGVSTAAPTTARLNFTAPVSDATFYMGMNFRSYDTVGFTYLTGTGSGFTTETVAVKRGLTVDKFIENAYIQKPFGDFSLSVGKVEQNLGGYERESLLSGDEYMASLANGSTVGLVSYAGSQTTTVAAPENQSGIEIGYTITPEHKVAVQILNQTNSAEASLSGSSTSVGANLTKSTNKRSSYSLQYEGMFADKMVSTLLQYGVAAADTQTQNIGSPALTQLSAVINNTYMSASVKAKLPASWLVLAEYFANSQLADATGSKKDATTSAVITARMHEGMYQPILSYEASENKIQEDSANASSFKRTAYSGALEIVPKAGDAFRYHIAYNSFSDAYGAAGLANSTVTNNQMIVGIKYAGDILK